MSNVKGGRKRGSSGRGRRTGDDEPRGEGGPDEAAAFIAEKVADLVRLARSHRLELLGHYCRWRNLKRRNTSACGASKSCHDYFRVRQFVRCAFFILVQAAKDVEWPQRGPAISNPRFHALLPASDGFRADPAASMAPANQIEPSGVFRNPALSLNLRQCCVDNFPGRDF